jgi:mannose/fructose/N-acetylgalactosamine-specific phosphotransferase system component IID
LGFLFTVLTGIERKKREDFLAQNSRIFFNTHPYMAGFIIGAVIKGYENNEDAESLRKHIMVGQSTFASTGDMLFWQTIRPATALLGVILGLKFGIIGPIISLILYNILHLYFRFYGFVAGYNEGWDVIYTLKGKKFLLTQRIFETVGAFLTGLLPVVLNKDLNLIFLIPLSGVFLILLWKRVAPILILTFVFILIIINLVLL